MAERITAVGCPEHSGCVVSFVLVDEGELGERVALRFPQPYQAWLAALPGQPVAVSHQQGERSSLSIIRREQRLEDRISKLEEFVTRKPRWKKAWLNAQPPSSNSTE